MTPARLAAGAALLGGVLWIVHALLGGGSDPVPATLHFVGLACLVLPNYAARTKGREKVAAQELLGQLRGFAHPAAE